MPRLTQVQRERAIGMLHVGRSFTDVARHFHVSISTVQRLWTRLRDTGSTNDRPRSGRPRVTTMGQDRHIRVLHLRDRRRAATVTATEVRGTHNDRISAQTVRNRLRAAGLTARRPYYGLPLSGARRHARLVWVNQHLRWPARMWRDILFTDESRFCLSRGDGRVRVWRRRGERFADCCVPQRDRWGGGSIMVWGGIHATGRTPLLVLQGNLNAQRYVDEVLRPEVVPYTRRHGLTLQQDNATPHSARHTQEFLAAEGVNVLPWPAFSPDLSPIEHLWDIMERRVRSRDPHPQTLPALRMALQEAWDGIPQEVIARLVASMRRRCTAVREAHGGHTRY